MISHHHQWPGVAGKVSNRFILAKDKDPHTLCNNCIGQTCIVDDHFSYCHDWNDEMWEKREVNSSLGEEG